ncbi:MAG: GTP 3',8-cyclase MoaA [Euryarchaeota archaeon]|jgi:cyclic pyranopterin phosphate synthase|nr:GTP 3',8-cyclase MoaA [Euryarchaeota archaeon]MBT3653985.1 GTP 3',8-cyclase MoaA [Euryarchaeota archaeon]MBT3758177.1 GTP 3',8-cyclase MoaA [Euryarchaeota archaeon]MBT4051231.1 GTP 3',8-cyclase MoaA [Euryarchaeota archaeon]MBT4346050.1 GTP 3',8-cyclase MoaA [Euryarchaeota archaeon]
MSQTVLDVFDRPLKDLRISVTDRCNFRCRYCMPRERFGESHTFLPRRALLSFEEIEKVVHSCLPLGLEKVRITGGEPLLRPGIADLVRRLSALNLEVALTTNGSLLRNQAEDLREAGLSRVTVSLDALDPKIHSEMTDSTISVEEVLDGIDAAQEVGLSPVKVNCVVQRGVNESEIEKLVTHFRGTDVIVRFIEYMDVGRTNGWQLGQIVPSEKILSHLNSIFDLVPLESVSSSDVAVRLAHSDGSGEIGFISSVTQPFCENCSRIRLSADGLLVTCLFATGGHDIRTLIQSKSSEDELNEAIAAIWQRRDDRYSENRSTETVALPRIEMSYIGG